MLVVERGKTTVGYTDEEAPPPDVDFTTSARIMTAVMITSPIDRRTARVVLSRLRPPIPVPNSMPPCDGAYRARRNSPTSRSHFEDEMPPYPGKPALCAGRRLSPAATTRACESNVQWTIAQLCVLSHRETRSAHFACSQEHAALRRLRRRGRRRVMDVSERNRVRGREAVATLVLVYT